MEIYQLRYFVAVAETENITKAAAQCNISQPSLSQQIINLEEELGQKLFHRLSRKISLTKAGQVLLERSRRILAEVNDAYKELRDDPRTWQRVSVGAIPTLAPYLLPKVIARCHMLHADMEIYTDEDFKPQLVDAVTRGELDLALVGMPVRAPNIISESLFKEPLMIVIGRRHPLADKEQITVSDIKDQSYIMLGTASSVTAQIQRFCGDNDFESRVVHRCSQVKTLKLLVGLGLGVAILPAGTYSPEDEQTLIYRNLSGSGTPIREIVLIRHSRHFLSQGATQFVACLRDALARAPIPLVSAPARRAVNPVKEVQALPAAPA